MKPSSLSMVKRIALMGGLGLAMVAGVVGWRAITWSSVQPEPATVERGELRPGAAKRLAEAVRFATITHTDRPFDETIFEDFLAWLADTYPLAHSRLSPERHGDYSLLLTWPGSDPSLEPVLMMAHYDVVPIEPDTEHEWTYPPFDGIIADGYVWGRGTLDDKAGVIGLFEAVEGLLAGGFEPRRTILLAFGHDEEIGGHDGAAAIARHLADQGLRLHWVLDEGGLLLEDHPMTGGPVALVSTAEKGYLSLRLVARTPGGHSSHPPQRTSVGLLAAAIERVQQRPFPARLEPPIGDMFDALASEVDGAMRVLMANQWLFGPIILRMAARDPQINALVRTTIAPTMLAAGDKDNVLPQRAEAVINFRLLPGDSVEDVTARVVAIVDDERIKIDRYGASSVEPSPVSSVDDPVYRNIAALIRGVWPDSTVSPFLLTGGTDSRHFQPLTDRIYRFRAVRALTEELSIIHGTDERVSVETFEQGIEFYRNLLLLETR